MKSLVKTFNSFAYEHDLWTLFSDWLDLAACSISCRVDFATREEREARYMAWIAAPSRCARKCHGGRGGRLKRGCDLSD